MSKKTKIKIKKKKTVLLIDVDSTIPNIPLMKLSAYHKSKKHGVKLLKLGIPYYPNRKKKFYTIPSKWDIIYASVIFEGNAKYVKGENIIFGGTGWDLKTNLPEEIDILDPDYSIYPDNDTSYGFISRGCIRNCYFCKVPKKEGKIKQVSCVDNLIKHKKIKFLDNNFLALHNHKDILRELRDKKIKHCFNQGLDIRLLDRENSKLLSELNYWGEYVFAFDDIRYLSLIKEKLKFLDWRKDWRIKMFVYVSPNMKIKDTRRRIIYLRRHKILPYIMRDISCWDSNLNNFFYRYSIMVQPTKYI